jgi:segregation and condensation protein B
MKHDLEALLFASDSALGIGRMKSILDTGTTEIRQAIEELNAEYEQQSRSFTIMEMGGGWQLVTRPEYSQLIRKLFKEKRYVRLSKAALEVLAIIAYRQPVTRLEIEEIRGVQVSSVLGTLNERNLITIVGRSDALGNPILYGTTREFLNYMGLKGLHQLPELPELQNIIDNRDDIRKFADTLGEELDEDIFETIAVEGDEIIVIDKTEEIAEDADDEDGPEAEEPTAGETPEADEPLLEKEDQQGQ